MAKGLKACPLVTTNKHTQSCVEACAWYVFYGRENEDRLGQCVLLKLADVLEMLII